MISSVFLDTFIQKSNFLFTVIGEKDQKDSSNSKYTLQEADHIETSTRDCKSFTTTTAFSYPTNKKLFFFL